MFEIFLGVLSQRRQFLFYILIFFGRKRSEFEE